MHLGVNELKCYKGPKPGINGSDWFTGVTGECQVDSWVTSPTVQSERVGGVCVAWEEMLKIDILMISFNFLPDFIIDMVCQRYR